MDGTTRRHGCQLIEEEQRATNIFFFKSIGKQEARQIGGAQFVNLHGCHRTPSGQLEGYYGDEIISYVESCQHGAP